MLPVASSIPEASYADFPFAFCSRTEPTLQKRGRLCLKPHLPNIALRPGIQLSVLSGQQGNLSVFSLVQVYVGVPIESGGSKLHELPAP